MPSPIGVGPRARDLLSILVVAAVAAILFQKVLFGGEVALTDSYARYFPWRSVAADSLLARPAWNTDNVEAYYPRRAVATIRIGERDLPLWCPWTAGGIPFAADPQAALFYPPNWPLFLAGDPGGGMGRFLAFHFLWAGVGAYLFLRRLAIGRGAALFGALAFMLNGFFATRTGHPTVVASCSWIPWTLLALDRFWDAPSVRRAALVGLALALAFLAGFPQAFLFLVYLVAALVVARAARRLRGREPGPVARPLALAALAVPLFAFGFAAIQLVPTAQLLGYSSREHWDYPTLLSSSMHPAMLLRAVQPDAYGNPLDANLTTGRFSRGNGYFIQSYVSTESYAGLAPLLLALAGLLLWKHRWRATLAGIAGVALLLAYGTPLLRLYRFLPGLAVSRVDRVIVLYLFAVAVLSAAGLGALAERAGRLRRPWGPAAAAAIVALSLAALLADLVPYGMRYNVSQPRAALPWDYWEIHYLDEEIDRVARAGEPAWAIYPGNVTAPLKIHDLQGMSDLPLRDWQELVETIEPGVYARRRLGPFKKAESLDSPILDLLDVKRLLFLAPRGGGEPGVKIVERPTVLPRAFVAPRYEVVAGRTERLARLGAPGFDPRAAVLLEAAPRRWTEGAGEARIALYEPERVVVEVEGEGGGLVLSDNWYPGWRASIDGAEVPILRGDHALRVVPLEPGRHTVVFTYRPATFYVGAALTALTCLVAAVMARRTAPRGA